MSYEIVHYHPDLRGEIAQLQTHLLSPDPDLNARYFQWKYDRNPYVGQPLIYLAMLDGHAVAMRGLHGSRWELGRQRETFTPLIADDLVVAPEHRNRRLVSRVMTEAFADAARRGYSHLLNLSGGPVTVFGSLAMGWRSAGTVNPMSVESRALARWRRAQRRLWRMHYFWRFANRPIVRRTLFYPWTDSRPFHQLDGASRRGVPIHVERTPPLDAMADLVDALGHDGRIRHVRDRQYFAWRFANPIHEYRFVSWENTHMEGYLVLQRSLLGRGGYRVRIVDVEAVDADVRANLVRWTVRAGRFPELFTWSATSSAEQRHLLAEVGFAPADTGRTARGVGCVLVRPVGDTTPESAWTVGGLNLLEMANWDLRVIYSMQG